MNHGKTVCKKCDTVLTSCRCIGDGVSHTTTYVICNSCQKSKPKPTLPAGPGRELDVLVSERVFNWKRHSNGRHTLTPEGCIAVLRSPKKRDLHTCHLPQYSTKIEDAWLVLEELKTRNFWFELRWVDEWQFDVTHGSKDPVYFATETIPHVICLAALKAVSND